MGAEQAFYKDPETLQAAIDSYFAKCDIPKQWTGRNKRGDVETFDAPELYTVEGLALHLGFTGRQGLWNYEKNANNGKAWAVDIVTRAKARIANQIVQLGMMGLIDSHMARLNLMSNFNYSEKRTDEFILTDDRISDDERRLLKDAAKHLAEQRKSLPMTTVSPDISD